MEELKVNHTYLFQFGSGDVLSSVTILIITDKAYHVRWNNDSKNTTWEQKKVFNQNYIMVEDITNYMINKQVIKIKTKLIQCPICHGFGTVPDDKHTAGNVTCPLCHGAKMIPESIER